MAGSVVTAAGWLLSFARCFCCHCWSSFGSCCHFCCRCHCFFLSLSPLPLLLLPPLLLLLLMLMLLMMIMMIMILPAQLLIKAALQLPLGGMAPV